MAATARDALLALLDGRTTLRYDVAVATTDGLLEKFYAAAKEALDIDQACHAVTTDLADESDPGPVQREAQTVVAELGRLRDQVANLLRRVEAFDAAVDAYETPTSTT